MLKLDDVRQIKMEIVKAPPPNAAEIERVFPGVTSGQRPVFFCYGRQIFNPSGAVIPLHLIAHEAAHAWQQETWLGIGAWWDAYLQNPVFRYQKEAEAHRVEHESFRELNNRHFSRRHLIECAERLAGPLYGNLITVVKARRVIAA